MVELPKTEAELQALIDERVNARETELKAEHDKAFANQRTKYESQIKTLKENTGKTAEEIAEQKIKEQQEADQKELAELRSYKKGKVIEERLTKEGLPTFLKNDTRLINANDEDFDKVMKEVKKEYDAVLPKGSQHSTVVQTSVKQPEQNEKDQAKQEFGQALKELIGK